MTPLATFPDLGPLVSEGESVCRQIAQTTITGPQEYAALQRAGSTCKAMIKEIEAQCAPMVKTTKAAYEAAKAFRDQHLDPLKTAMDIASRKTGDWKVAQDRAVAIAQAEATARARQQAEAEQLAQAVALDAAGHSRVAEALLETPPIVADVRLPNLMAPKIAHTPVRTYWKARLACGHEFDGEQSCCFQSRALIPREYLMPDAKAIGAYGRQWGEAAAIEGVSFYPEHKSSYSDRDV